MTKRIKKKLFKICLQPNSSWSHRCIKVPETRKFRVPHPPSLVWQYEQQQYSGEKNAPLEPSEKTAHPQKVFLRKTLSQKIAFYSCRKRAPFILASKVPAKRYLISQLMAKLYQKDLSGPSNLRQVPIKISAA